MPEKKRRTKKELLETIEKVKAAIAKGEASTVAAERLGLSYQVFLRHTVNPATSKTSGAEALRLIEGMKSDLTKLSRLIRKDGRELSNLKNKIKTVLS